MVDIVILCPIPIEFWAVYQHLEKPEEQEDSRFTISYYLGTISLKKGKWKVALLETGPKVENLKSITEKVIDVLRPKYVFLTGVAGGVKDVNVGDVVVATKAYGYESGKETQEGFIPRPEVVNHPAKILSLCRSLEKKYYYQQKSFKIVFGPIASGNKVVAARDSETFKIIKRYYSDTVAVEMEAIGFTKAAAEAGIQFANIRGISDLLDNKSESDKLGSQELASGQAASFLIDLIRLLPKQEQTRYKSLEVKYMEKKVTFFDTRNPKKGSLLLKEEHIELSTEEEIHLIKDIRQLKHIAMPGDLFANWVLVEYRNGDNWSTLYFSTVSPVGLGYWIGGSKQLLKEFEPYRSAVSPPVKVS